MGTVNKYIGIAKSSYQILNILNYLATEKKSEDKVVVYYDSYFKNSKPLSKFLVSISEKLNVSIVNSLSIMGELDEEYDRIIILGCKVPLNMFSMKVRLRERVKFVKIDDGIGSYQGFSSLYNSASTEFSGSIIKKLFFPVKYLQDKIYELMFVNEWHQSWSSSSKYREGTEIIFDDFCRYEKKEPFSGKGIALFCSQPFVDLGVISTVEQDKIIEKARDISKKNDLVFRVLKHPSDVNYKYDINEVVNYEGLFDEYLYLRKDSIKLVMSINSSCLITAKVNFNIDCISIGNEVTHSLEKFWSKKVKRMFGDVLIDNIKV